MKRPKVRKSTVFVLGAGSAVDIGFPTGAGLVSEIVRICRNFLNRDWVDSIEGAPKLVGAAREQIFRARGISESDYPLYAELFNRFHRTFPRADNLIGNFALDLAKSSTNTIDFFLGRNKHYAELGRFCIAAILAQRENPYAVIEKQGNWYQYFINTIYWEPDHLLDNALDFLTFNYDVSLEYFLLNRLVQFCGSEIDPAIEKMKLRSVRHVYGTVGSLAGGYLHDTRRYGALDWDRIKTESDKIKIVQENRTDQEWAADRERMADFWDGVEVVYFLGFGFDPLNIKKIHLEENLNGKKVLVHLHSPTADLEARVKGAFAPDEVPWPKEVEITRGGSITNFLQMNPPWV